jgi:uncharacterized protein (DUF849 family)
LHIHPRDAEGQQTLASLPIGVALSAIRALCPTIAIGVSTAAWIEPDTGRRLQFVQDWQVLPDFASVNFSEPGAAELCRLLSARGIAIEAGLATADDAQLLLSLGSMQHCIRVLIEPDEQGLDRALARVREIERVLDGARIQTPRLLHGGDATAWPLLVAAFECGYESRIGLEDTLRLPDGRLARDNAELIAVAYKKIRV